MEFTVRIHMGNEGMETGLDVATALRDIADRAGEYGSFIGQFRRPVKDCNGNTVGEWGITE